MSAIVCAAGKRYKARLVWLIDSGGSRDCLGAVLVSYRIFLDVETCLRKRGFGGCSGMKARFLEIMSGVS